MVSYKDLTQWDASERRRTIDRLLALRAGLAQEGHLEGQAGIVSFGALEHPRFRRVQDSVPVREGRLYRRDPVRFRSDRGAGGEREHDESLKPGRKPLAKLPLDPDS